MELEHNAVIKTQRTSSLGITYVEELTAVNDLGLVPLVS